MSQTPASDAVAPRADHHKTLRDLVVGGLSVGAALLGAISHFAQGGRLHDDYGAEPGPALLPELLLAALAAVGVLLILRGLLGRRAAQTPAAPVFAPDPPLAAASALPLAPAPAPATTLDAPGGDTASPQPSRALAAFLATITFGVLQTVIGFGAAACLLGAALSAAFGLGQGRSLPRSAAEGLAVAAILYAIFRYVLSVPLT